jgi:NADH:ubiquinone oxidoreductase subunit K
MLYEFLSNFIFYIGIAKVVNKIPLFILYIYVWVLFNLCTINLLFIKSYNTF